MYPFSTPHLELDVARHAALLEMADVLSRHHDPSDLFRALAPTLRAVVPFDFLNFATYEPATQIMQLHIWSGGEWPIVPREVSVKDSAVGWVWENQYPLIIDDLERETRFVPGFEWLRQYHLRSYCVVALTSPHTKLGALGFGNQRPNAFLSRHVEYLSRVAEIVALCIDKLLNASTLTEEKKRVELLLSRTDAVGMANLRVLSPQFLQGKYLAKNARWIAQSTDQQVLSVFTESGDPMLAAYFGSSTVGLSVVDRQMRYLAINEALATMHGMPPAEHVGKTTLEVLGELARQFEPGVERVFASGEPVLNYEGKAVLPKGGEARHWLCHFFPIRNRDGDVDRVGTIVLEISKQKKLEESFRILTGTLKDEKDRLQLLLEMSQVLAANWDAGSMFPKVSSVLRRVLRHEGAFFSLYDEDNNVLVRQAMDFPLSKGLFSAVPAVTAGGPQGQAIAERRALTFSREDIAAFQADPSGTIFEQSLLGEGIRSLCCVPLIRPGGTVGALSLISTRADAFRGEDLSLLNQVGAQIAIAMENAGAALQIKELKDRLAEEKRNLDGEVATEVNFEEIVGTSPPLKKILAKAATVASSTATVLILGETGTGKELIARAIHRLSDRRSRSFIKLNCAAIPTGLLESELFGHEKGAFTGAVSQKVGRMELANGGTLFLDEVGEISLELQPKLLRVLQDQEFERLGGTRTIKVDVRLIAATNRDLETSVTDHEFRSDLFYRLNVFPIRMPALRERRSDIPMLVRFFVQKFARRLNRNIESIPAETINALMNWDWPGNVRELENFIERSVILTEGKALHAPMAELTAHAEENNFSDRSLENAEREHILRVLRESRGVIAGPEGAAHRLGLKRTTLQSKVQKLGIRREEYMDPNKE